MNYNELSLKQKQFWENLSYNIIPIQSVWIKLCQRNKCIWCKKEFDGGITNKYPGKFISINAYVWFTTEYLVHCQTTHGFSPEILTEMLNEIS